MDLAKLNSGIIALVVAYTVSAVTSNVEINEVGVTIGNWAMGAFIFSLLVRTGVAIELGKIKFKK